MSKATPRPWNLQNDTVIWGKNIGDRVCNVEEMCFGINTPTAKANAELIVRAVNCHDELVAILKAYIAEHEIKYPNMKNTLNALNDLLKRARGE